MPDNPTNLSFPLTPENLGFLQTAEKYNPARYFFLGNELHIVGEGVGIKEALLRLTGEAALDFRTRPTDIGKIHREQDVAYMGGSLPEHSLQVNSGLHYYNDERRITAATVLANAIRASTLPLSLLDLQVTNLRGKLLVLIPLR